MGTGKTSIGRRTAEIMGLNFVDTDLLIEKTVGLPISKIFIRHGESFFRQQEFKAASKVSQYKNCVIATGGGIVTVSNCMELLAKKGFVIWLKVPLKIIMDRVKQDVGRPLANKKNEGELETIYKNRLPLYYKYCDESIDLTGKTIDQAATEIVELCEKTGYILFKKKEI